jgi:hypothetical protein
MTCNTSKIQTFYYCEATALSDKIQPKHGFPTKPVLVLGNIMVLFIDLQFVEAYKLTK